MGYSADGNTFWPDDDENTIYLDSSYQITLADVMEVVKWKWGNSVDLDFITINAENMHTKGMGYDFSDYTNFIMITKDA